MVQTIIRDGIAKTDAYSARQMTVVRPELCSRRLACRHSGKNKIGHEQTLVLPAEKKPLIIRGREN